MSQAVPTLQPRRSTRHPHYTTVEARRILADAGASGLTLYAYARHHRIDAGLLYWWRGKPATGPSGRKHRATAGAAMPLTFVPMVAAEPDRPPVAQASIDDLLPAGWEKRRKAGLAAPAELAVAAVESGAAA